MFQVCTAHTFFMRSSEKNSIVFQSLQHILASFQHWSEKKLRHSLTKRFSTFRDSERKCIFLSSLIFILVLKTAMKKNWFRDRNSFCGWVLWCFSIRLIHWRLIRESFESLCVERFHKSNENMAQNIGNNTLLLVEIGKWKKSGNTIFHDYLAP